MITFEDFKKLDIRIGKILSAEKVEGTDKLLKLEVDFGSDVSSDSTNASETSSAIGKRQIISGIAQYYSPESLVGKLCPFIVNLEYRMFKGVESQGMIMAADLDGEPILMHPNKEVPSGSVVK